MPPSADADLFEAAYTAGITAPEEPSKPPQNGGPERLVGAAAAGAFALKGCVLTPARAHDPGYVVVDGGEIATVAEAKPEGVPVHDTGGVILPGLIDLHGHPEFNVFAAWDPPRQFPNRYAWRSSPLYQRLVREPQNRLLDALPVQTQLRYAEVRALVGGVTAIQGTSERVERLEAESLVRNVDRVVFGQHRARAMIDLPSEGGRDMERLGRILGQIEDDQVDAFYVHLAEGRSDNERSREEFGRLVDLHALTAATVVIHGTALSRDQLADLRDAGAKLVWSPQSNLRLYGETTRAADALDLDLPVGLGADWLPSGSQSLLAELTVARNALREQGTDVPAKRLVEMVTSDAAEIAGLGDKLGKLAAGRPADLVVLQRWHEDPYENVVEADPAWVDLVLIGGDLTYGRADWIEALAAHDDRGRLEPLIAWGKPMLIDTGYSAQPTDEQAPPLSQLREDLIQEYPQVGPIFA